MVAPIYNYTLEILKEPMAIIASLPKDIRRQIGHRLDLMQRDFTGDIKKLHGKKNEYRLRVGSYRILFRLIDAHLVVYDVGDRKDIYAR